MISGGWFRGRPVTWDPDRQAVEMERQRWVMENLDPLNRAIVELTVDPAKAYAAHRTEYERTGDLTQLRLMLEYVTT